MERTRAGRDGMRVRDSLVSGIFYPDDPEELARVVDGLLAGVSPGRNDASALLCPHAAISYSGALQALAFASARARIPRTIILLCHRHRPDMEAAFLPESAFFRTPLGDVAIDIPLLEEIESCATFYERTDIPHMEENALEVQLPFIQRLFPESSILPVIVNFHTSEFALQLARDIDVATSKDPDSFLLVAACNAGSAPLPEDARKMGRLLATRVLGDGKSKARPCVEAFMASRFVSKREGVVLGRGDSREALEKAPGDPWTAWEGETAVVEYISAAFFKK